MDKDLKLYSVWFPQKANFVPNINSFKASPHGNYRPNHSTLAGSDRNRAQRQQLAQTRIYTGNKGAIPPQSLHESVGRQNRPILLAKRCRNHCFGGSGEQGIQRQMVHGCPRLEDRRSPSRRWSCRVSILHGIDQSIQLGRFFVRRQPHGFPLAC